MSTLHPFAQRVAIVLTDNYPYNTGEEFFEQEIDLLAKSFRHVYICPVRASASSLLTRELPGNVSTFLLPEARIPSWQLRAIAMFPRIFWGRERMVENPPWNFGHWGMDVRFSAIALDVRDRFVRVFPWHELSSADEILIYSYWFFTGAALGGMLRRRELKNYKVRVVSRAHAYDVDEKDAPRGYIPSRSFVMNAVNKVYPISNYAAKFLRDRFPQRLHDIEVRRLGVPSAHAAPRMKKPLHLHIVSCSHLAPYKRVWLIGDTVVELEKRGYSVRWTHIGERDQSKLDDLAQSVKSRAVSVQINFTGYMRNHDVRKLYRDVPFTCFVNASDGEGVPVSIMEAQASGLPVVATDAGGTAEIVLNGQNGYIVPVETSSAELADAIERVNCLTDSEYALQSKEALGIWESRSNAEKQYRNFVYGLNELWEGEG